MKISSLFGFTARHLMLENFIHFFETPILEKTLPLRINNPFENKQSEIMLTAVEQTYGLIERTSWNHNFGLNEMNHSKPIGKMFGVLIVKTADNELGFLAGFSGKIGESNHFKGFVPPVYDSLAENSFLKNGMDKLVSINEEIAERKAAGLEIDNLKDRRRKHSNSLQDQIYQSYRLSNSAGELKSIKQIFKETTYNNPPGGAAECAAPKLFQYAFLNQLKPVAISEFWWGIRSKSGEFDHKQFYTPCTNKCEPILKFMLAGLI